MPVSDHNTYPASASYGCVVLINSAGIGEDYRVHPSKLFDRRQQERNGRAPLICFIDVTKVSRASQPEAGIADRFEFKLPQGLRPCSFLEYLRTAEARTLQNALQTEALRARIPSQQLSENPQLDPLSALCIPRMLYFRGQFVTCNLILRNRGAGLPKSRKEVQANKNRSARRPGSAEAALPRAQCRTADLYAGFPRCQNRIGAFRPLSTFRFEKSPAAWVVASRIFRLARRDSAGLSLKVTVRQSTTGAAYASAV